MTTQDDIKKAQRLFTSALDVTDDFTQTALTAAIVAAIDNLTSAVKDNTRTLDQIVGLMNERGGC